MVAHILQKSLDLTAALKFLHILNTVKFNLDQPMGVGSFKVIIRATVGLVKLPARAKKTILIRFKGQFQFRPLYRSRQQGNNLLS